MARFARYAAALALAVVLASWAPPHLAHAHPMGASSINRALDFTYVGGGKFRVAYALDFAEGPAYAEVEALDADHDGKVTPEEQRRYLDTRLPPLIDAWVVLVDGVRVRPTVVASHVDVTPGEGALDTLRIDAELAVVATPPHRGTPLTVYVRDDAFKGSPGWREIGAEGAKDAGSDPLALATIETTTGDGGAIVLEGRTPRMADARFIFRPRVEVPPPARVPAVALVLFVVAVGLSSVALLWARRRPRGER